MSTSKGKLPGLIVLATLLVVSTPALATWSIVAVDPETGEVGLAAATCNSQIQFIAEAVPGRGVVAAQAATSFKGRDAAKAWMAEGVAADEILRRLSNPEFYSWFFNTKFPDLQYGVATSGENPAAGFTGGDSLVDWAGGTSDGKSWSVQGNMLRGEDVIISAAAGVAPLDDGECHLTLGERLLRGMEAGRGAGGDKRCPKDAPVQSAILLIAGPDDEAEAALNLVAPRRISFLRAIWHSIFGYTPKPGAKEPIAHLREKYVAAGGKSCRSGLDTPM